MNARDGRSVMARKMTPVYGLLLALLIVQPRPVDAQTRISLSAGTTFATLDGDDAGRAVGGAADLDSETGFFAGASLGVPLGDLLFISPGLYFVQKGTWVNANFSGAFSVELSYIELPVTIGVTVPGAEPPFGVRFFAGPEIAFEVDCDIEPDGSIGFSTLGEFADCHPPSGVEESERKTVDLGLVFGADLSFGSFFVRGGRDVGLTSLDDSDADEDFKNSAWFLGAGIVIGG